MISLKEQGASAAYCNIGIRALNAFFSWAKEERIVTDKIRLKLLKHHPKPVTPFSEPEIKLVMANKPKRMTYQRTWLLAILLLDTGLRVDEALRLKKQDIDLDNLLLTVRGKGDKPRLVPFSFELRKHLFSYVERMEKSKAVHRGDSQASGRRGWAGRWWVDDLELVQRPIVIVVFF